MARPTSRSRLLTFPLRENPVGTPETPTRRISAGRFECQGCPNYQSLVLCSPRVRSYITCFLVFRIVCPFVVVQRHFVLFAPKFRQWLAVQGRASYRSPGGQKLEPTEFS